jgi:hypothetical protein
LFFLKEKFIFQEPFGLWSLKSLICISFKAKIIKIGQNFTKLQKEPKVLKTYDFLAFNSLLVHFYETKNQQFLWTIFWTGICGSFGSFYFLFTIVMKVLISCTENPKFFIEVLDELELFIDKKWFLTKKTFPSVRRLPSVNKFCNPHNFFSFQPRHFSFSG